MYVSKGNHKIWYNNLYNIQGSSSRATDILRLKRMNGGIQYLNLERESHKKAVLKESLIFDWRHRSPEVTHQKEDRGRNIPTSLCFLPPITRPGSLSAKVN